MTLEDIPAVLAIDQESFPIPWSERTYRFELLDNEAAHLFVAVDGTGSGTKVVGYIGFWTIIDEMHISTLATASDWRRRGVAEQLLKIALREGHKQGAMLATLEVRVSNRAAIHLYEKYGFEGVGTRKGYYRDNHEDALLMTAEDISRISQHWKGEA